MNSSKDPSSESADELERAIAEYLERVDRGEVFRVEDWLSKYPAIKNELLEFLDTEREFDGGFSLDPQNRLGNLDETMEMPPSSFVSPSNHLVNSDRRKRLGGRTEIGSYKLSRLLGSGGMGEVYEAVDPNGNRVAVKILSQQWSRSPESLQRFKLEGKIASAINHPRCVFVRAADEFDGVPYIVMELMTGKTLKDLTQETGPMAVNRAIQVIMDVLDGLEEAHSHGMIHRDIKPGNCYLESNGRVKLGDFGLARSVEDQSDLTRTGDFVGTPLFASPEQVKGQATDVRTDIYSVCATLYFLLAGQAPFAGSTPTNVIARIVSEDPTPLRQLNPQVPVLLERIIMRGLARDRKLRFQTVAELKQALEPFVRGRHAIAAWGRRFAAYCIDSAINGCIGGVVALFVAIDENSAALPWTVYLTLLVPIIVYHLIFEGIGFASIGKLALRLQIADRVTGERPHRIKVVVRTLIAMLLMGFGSDLLIYLTSDPTDVYGWYWRQWAGYSVSYLIMLAPILFTKRYRLLLHDWVSGTMVVDRPKKTLQQQLAKAAAEYRSPILSSAAYPSKMGEFSVVGTVFTTGEMVVLYAKDEKLNRNVWIWLRSVNMPELNLARRQCDRATRLRWLSNGRFDNWQWDAFLAPLGAPLKHWTAPESPLSWKETRIILRQLAAEIEDSTWDSIPITLNSLDQLWLDTRGRLSIVDWSTSVTMSSEQSPHSGGDQTRAFLCEAARLCLCGKSLPIEGDHPPISAIVPIHVRELLTTLSDSSTLDGISEQEKLVPFTAAQFVESLDSYSQRATEPSYENRLLGLGMLLTPALLLLGTMCVLSRMGNILVMDKITDQLVAPAIVERMLQDMNQEEKSSNPSGDDELTREELEAWLQRQTSNKDELTSNYLKRYEGLDSFSRILSKEMKLQENPSTQLPNVSVERSGSDFVVLNWKADGERTEFSLASLKRLVRAPAEANSEELIRRGPLWITIVTLVPFLVAIAWGALTGGGLSLLFSGLRVVRSDGTPANWCIRGLRPILAGLPFLALQSFITYNDLLHSESLWMSHLAHQLMLWSFLGYAILIVVFPRRAPHDWLLGTHFVTR